MKILIIGNLGYVGPSAVRQLRKTFKSAEIIGLDVGYFSHSLTNCKKLPETLLDRQIFADVRDVNEEFLKNHDLLNSDKVVYLAALSNDAMCDFKPEIAYDVNWKSALRIAEIFKNEWQNLDVYALRFATACGFTDRTRLDLVLNDFAACSLTTGEITVLSDGSPWRPQIHIEDMGRACAWAATEVNFVFASSCAVYGSNGADSRAENDELEPVTVYAKSKMNAENDLRKIATKFEPFNVGSNRWNFQVRDYANQVGELIAQTKISINQNASPDKRSYKVDFTKFENTAPKEFQVQVELPEAITKLHEGLSNVNELTNEFRNSELMRIVALKNHINAGRLNDDLRWEN